MFLKRFRRGRPQTDRHSLTGDALSRPNEYVSAYRTTGDLAILGELYEAHMELVYAVCFNYLRDEEEAKDAVMNLFEQLVTDLRRHDVQQFGPWLHSVARNYCLMQLRRKQSHPTVTISSPTDVDDADYEPFTNDHDPDDLEETLSRMEIFLEQLPPEQQTCLRLFYLDRKSYAEVAALTGFDLKQVKSYLQNGRRNLKICLSR